MNPNETISPQMLEVPKSLSFRSFCFQNDHVSTKVRLICLCETEVRFFFQHDIFFLQKTEKNTVRNFERV